jgi:hypothetical protein
MYLAANRAPDDFLPSKSVLLLFKYSHHIFNFPISSKYPPQAIFHLFAPDFSAPLVSDVFAFFDGGVFAFFDEGELDAEFSDVLSSAARSLSFD